MKWYGMGSPELSPNQISGPHLSISKPPMRYVHAPFMTRVGGLSGGPAPRIVVWNGFAPA